MNLLHREIIDIELLPAVIDRGGHWGKTAARRKEYEGWLRQHGKTRKPFDQPVRIEMIRILGKRQRLWDADNCGRGNAKQIIDALVAVGWFHDDKPKWITEATFTQDDSRRDIGPCTEIRIYDA